MSKLKSKYSIKEKFLISFSFWPTLFIGVALGMAICLLLISKYHSIFQFMSITTNSIIALVILGIVTRGVSIYIWKKYNWSFKSDMK